MSSPVAKGMRRSASRQSSAKSSTKRRPLKTKSAQPKHIVKRTTGAKAPARKAAKVVSRSAPKKQITKPRKSVAAKSKTPKIAATRKAAPAKSGKKAVTVALKKITAVAP